MQFEALLSRADIGVLQDLIGQQSLQLMGLLNVNASAPRFLRDVLLQSSGAVGLLLDKRARNLLLDLLRPNEAVLLATALGLPNDSKSTYDYLKATQFGKGSAKESSLFHFFELSVPKMPEAINDDSIQGIQPEYPLFPHQRVAARKILRALTTPPYRVLLHMPTGSGKTRTAMNIVADLMRGKEPNVVIWVAYSEELCTQACEEFAQAWRLVGDRSLNIYKLWGKRDIKPEEITDGFVVAGLPKLEAKAQKSIQFLSDLGTRCSAVVIDEAHQAVAPTYKTILDSLISHRSDSALLGLTATPGRTWNNVTADEELAEFFFRRKVSLEIAGYSNPVDYLVENKYLAKATFVPLLYQGGIQLSAADRQLIQRSLDLPEAILERLSDNETRNLAIVIRIQELIKRHQRIIVFASSVKHAELLASVLFAQGHLAHAITSKTAPSERARLIAEYRGDDASPRLLINFGVLTTGFDAPKTSAAVIARPTKSLVLYSQMVGRAIRGPAAKGNANAEIVTVVDQGLPGFGNVGDAFNNWEDIWL